MDNISAEGTTGSGQLDELICEHGIEPLDYTPETIEIMHINDTALSKNLTLLEVLHGLATSP